MKLFAVALNTAVAAGIVAFGFHAIPEAKAAQEQKQWLTESEQMCLRQNVYWEARNQSELGMAAVAWLTFNRVESKNYPNTICGVVKQGLKNADGSMKRHKCQFSWYCDGLSDKIPSNKVEQQAWLDAIVIADAVTQAWFADHQNPVGESIMYHATSVSPYWKTAYTQVVQIDDHIFYE